MDAREDEGSVALAIRCTECGRLWQNRDDIGDVSDG